MCGDGVEPAKLTEVRELLKWAKRNPYAMRSLLKGAAGVYSICIDSYMEPAQTAWVGGGNASWHRLDNALAKDSCSVTNDHVELAKELARDFPK